MWIFTLPWTVAYLVYETSWTHWLRLLLVALIIVEHRASAVRALRRGKRTADESC